MKGETFPLLIIEAQSVMLIIPRTAVPHPSFPCSLNLSLALSLPHSDSFPRFHLCSSILCNCRIRIPLISFTLSLSLSLSLSLFLSLSLSRSHSLALFPSTFVLLHFRHQPLFHSPFYRRFFFSFATSHPYRPPCRCARTSTLDVQNALSRARVPACHCAPTSTVPRHRGGKISTVTTLLRSL